MRWYKLLQSWADQDKKSHSADDILQLDETIGKALVESGIAEETKDDPTKTLIADLVAGVRPAMKAMFTEAIISTIDEIGKDKGKIVVGKNLAEDDPTWGWPTLASFAMGVHKAHLPGNTKIDERLLKAPSGMHESDDAYGGYLIPPQHLTTLLELAWERSDIATRCQPIPMQTNMIDMPALVDTDRRAGYRQGGISLKWIAESEQKIATRPKFRKVGLKLNELIGLVPVTNSLLEDSPVSIEPLLNTMFAEEFALVIDEAILSGTGAGQPLGILNAPCLVSVTPEIGQAATTIVTENIIKMWSRVWDPSRKKGAWFVNSDILPQLMVLQMTVGTGGAPMWLPANGLADSPHGQMLGRPLIFQEQCQTLGTQGDIIFADFSHYLIGQKTTGIQAQTSIHLYFDYDEVAFRFVMRIDGQPWLDKAITPMHGAGGGADTKSPFVVLGDR